MLSSILIIPDVHGRQSWKAVVEKRSDYSKIVFLGDYLDHSKKSGVSNKQSVNNFKDILKFAESRQNVVLLLGNHDIHYIIPGLKYPGFNSTLNYHFKELYRDYRNLFCFHSGINTQDGINVLITHAGVLPSWLNNAWVRYCSLLNKRLEPITQDNLLDIVDQVLPVLSLPQFSCLLDQASKVRGGESPHGSPIWADDTELKLWSAQQDNFGDTIQVVGHSKTPGITSALNSPRRGVIFTDCLQTKEEFLLLDFSTGTITWRIV